MTAVIKNCAKWLRDSATQNNAHKLMRSGQGIVMGLVRALILLGVCYIILSPVFGIISNTFKSVSDIYNPLVYLIPEAPTFVNLTKAFTYMSYVATLSRTLIYTLGLTLMQILITSMVGYGFARFNFPGREILFAVVIVTIVVPAQTYMVPMYMQFRYFNLFGTEINLIDKFWPIILLTLAGTGLRSGLYIYIFRQFFRGLPKEIEEAALIDGAGNFRTYLTIMMPNAMSAIVTVVMFSLVWQYNDTYYSSLFMPSIDLLATKLTAVGNIYISKESIRDPNLVRLVVNAAIVLMIAPIITIFMVMQRYFMEGIERSGIVG